LAKLNFGCGQRRETGYLGLDICPCEGVDIVHDFNRFPYPFGDDEFDEILCRSSLEHVADFVGTVVELHRILKPNGLLRVYCPHYSGPDAYRDPTHRTFFAWTTFDMFIDGGSYRTNYSGLFTLESRSFGVPGRHWGPKALAKRTMNHFPDLYETYFCWMFPAKTISYELKAVKWPVPNRGNVDRRECQPQ
jgi:SAM-dependent methyltransferase